MHIKPSQKECGDTEQGLKGYGYGFMKTHFYKFFFTPVQQFNFAVPQKKKKKTSKQPKKIKTCRAGIARRNNQMVRLYCLRIALPLKDTVMDMDMAYNAGTPNLLIITDVSKSFLQSFLKNRLEIIKMQPKQNICQANKCISQNAKIQRFYFNACILVST